MTLFTEILQWHLVVVHFVRVHICNLALQTMLTMVQSGFGSNKARANSPNVEQNT